jgi:tetratricopeptide (TPR) repeat protein
MVLPQTLMGTILEELNVFSRTEDEPDPFTKTRLRREIKKLANVDYAGSLLCEAVLFTLEKNYDGVTSKFKTILEVLPNDADMHENYANSLGRLLRLNEAQTEYMAAMRLAKVSEGILIEIANNAQITLRLDDLKEAVSIFEKATGKTDLSYIPEVESGLQLIGLFDWHEVSYDNANKFYSAAETVCVEHGITIYDGQFHHTAPFGGPTLTFYAGIDADADRIADLNFELCDKIIDADLSGLMHELSFVFIASEGPDKKKKEEHNAYNI